MNDENNAAIINEVSLSLGGLISVFNLLAQKDETNEYSLSGFAWYIREELEKLRNSVNSIKL
jgi:hypothetical protein